MSEKGSKLDEEIRKGLSELETVRDEIRVNLHLAKMEAKDQWAKLEPHVDTAKQLAREATTTARDKLRDLAERARAVRDAIRSPKK
jgi:hypothetical protein